jgi:type IV pilus assembly protein PilC
MKPPILMPEAGSILFAQLAAATRHSLPLRDVLDILRQDRALFGRGHPAVEALGEATRAGAPLSSAMRSLPHVFAGGTSALVAAGEEQERLPTTLQGLADDFQRLGAARRAVRAALTWPIVLLVGALLLALLIIFFVVPSFQEVFTSFGADLPLLTRGVISVSDAAVGHPWLLVLLVVGIVLWRRRRLPPRWLDAIDGLPLRIPVVRQYLANRHVARLLSWLTLFGDSSALRQAALQHVRDTTQAPALRADLDKLEAQLAGQPSLADALRGLDSVPERVVLFARLGEKTGGTASALALLHDITTEEETRALRTLQLGLLLWAYAFIGIVVGVLLIAMYLPIFRLGSVV